MPDDEQISVDPRSFTIREVMAFEEATGLEFGEQPTGRDRLVAAAGYIWIVRRRSDAGYTYEQALDEPIGALTVVDATPGPTSPPNRTARRRKSG